MQINLNHRAEDVPTEGVHFFGELMERVSRKAESDGARILKVKLNGEDITGKDRTDLNKLPLDEIQEVEVHTGDPRVLARSSLYSVADFLEKLLAEMQSTAELFRLGNEERSNQSFMRCLDGMQVFMHSLESCRRLLGISFELLFVPVGLGNDDVTVAENRRRLFEVLDGMIEAQTNKDWLLLADLLEYELVPILEDWRQIIPAILKETEPGAPVAATPWDPDAENQLLEECTEA
ncbi:MAG: hypothetical protein C4524_05650 [Candidatus Zixiibacteriota bacterium]|nr:MAG: hypothetical protein C4524_05650 [candidate division Zixibacteria bacterium]